MQDKSLDKVTFGLIDGGSVSGAFTLGLLEAVLETNVPFSSALRHRHVYVAKNRRDLLHNWLNNTNTEWLFWVDSDIVLNKEAVEKIWNSADKDSSPVVSGLYFYPIQDRENFTIKPCIYNFSNHPHNVLHIDDFEKDALIKIEAAGFGCLLMHRSVIEKLIGLSGYVDFFGINAASFQPTDSEDFNFFSYLLKYNIPVYAHTGAIVDHVKPILVNDHILNISNSYNDKK